MFQLLFFQEAKIAFIFARQTNNFLLITVRMWSLLIDIMFFFQKLLSACVWKEYTTDAGRLYFHNIETKESSWIIPKELQEIKDKIAAEEVAQ